MTSSQEKASIGEDETKQHDEPESERETTGKGKAPDSLRRSQACLACRKRKLRCDAKKPTCSRCETAWRAFGSGSQQSSAAPPPCEYDVSLFSKMFKRTTTPESSSTASDPTLQRASTSRLEQRNITQNMLQVDNQKLRARISLLEADLYARSAFRDSAAGSSMAGSTEGMRTKRRSVGLDYDREQPEPSVYKRKLSAGLTSELEKPTPSHQRSTLQPPGQEPRTDSGEDRSQSKSMSSRLFQSSSSPTRDATSLSTPSSTVPTTPFPRSSLNDKVILPPISADAHHAMPLPLPPRALMLELVDSFATSSWLAFAFDVHVLRDLVVVLDSSIPSPLERYVSEAILMALVAVSLPFCPSVVPQLVDIVGSRRYSTTKFPDSLGSTNRLTHAYASSARALMRQIRKYEDQNGAHDTFSAQILLVEYALSNDTTRDSHVQLAQAVVEARFLDIHDMGSGISPRLESRSTKNTQLSHKLRSLMLSHQHNYAFWYLYIQDCLQSRLSGLPSLIDRDSIRTAFPGRVDPETAQTMQDALSEVGSYLRKETNLPTLAPADNTFCVLLKSTMVLEDCCDFAVRVRRTAISGPATMLSDLRQGRDSSFQSINEGIRLLRVALNQFNGRSRPNSKLAEGSSGLLYHEVQESRDALSAEDLLGFAADTTHHLCVLTLFGGLIDTEEPFEQSDSRDVVKTAATWISRLAETTLRPGCLLSLSLAPGCSMAFFIAARWCIYLQIAFPTEFQLELSTLTAAIWARATNCSNDCKCCACIRARQAS